MLKLHCTPGTVSLAAAITLQEAGLAHELIVVDFAKAEQTRPAYLAINPKGRVPALETPDGILTETGAILDHIAALAPAANLVPSDPFLAGKMREMMYYLASTMHVNHAHGPRGSRWASRQSSLDDMRAKVQENMKASCVYVESHIKGPFVIGNSLTLADPYLFTVSTWLASDGVDIADYSRLAAHHAAMRQRPSVRAMADKGLL